MSEISIRQADADDAPLLLKFIRELAEYENAPQAVKTDVAQLRETLLSQEARARALVASVDGEPAGYAVYFYNYSTWLGRNGIYLEDVYVTPRHRGKGAGKALLKRVAAIAVADDCGRFEWSVLNWNRPAIEFYEYLGARAQSEWTTYRLEGRALRELGGG